VELPHCNEFLGLCMKESMSATATTSQFGVWKRASPLANITKDTPSILDRFRLKEWNYVSVSSDRYFVAVALVRFSYVSDVFVYVVDKRQDKVVKFEYTARLPFGLGVEIAQSSLQGCSKWGNPPKKEDSEDAGGPPWLQLCSKIDGGWRMRGNVPVYSPSNERRTLQMDFEFGSNSDDALAMVYPLGGRSDRRAYTHKAAALVDKGWVRFGANTNSISLEGAAAGMDWTRSLALRTTVWKWASIHDTSASSSGKSIKHLAINLSQFVYDVVNSVDPTKRVSVENVVWVNGRSIRLLQPLTISMPTPESNGKWTIRSVTETPDELVDLTFTGLGQREDHANFGIVVSDFVQPFGQFEGTIRIFSYSIGRHLHITLGPLAFGVVEDHHAVW